MLGCPGGRINRSEVATPWEIWGTYCRLVVSNLPRCSSIRDVTGGYPTAGGEKKLFKDGGREPYRNRGGN